METIVSLRNFVNGCILEEHQRLAGAFHAIMNNREADIFFKMKRSGIENESWYIKILFQKDFSCKCQFCITVRAPSRLVSEVWAKYKEVSSKLLKRHTRTNPNQQTQRFVFGEYSQTSQWKINVRKKAIQKFWNHPKLRGFAYNPFHFLWLWSY